MSDEFKLPIEHDGVLKLLPHRYPFLMIDRVVEYERGRRVLCHKSVSAAGCRTWSRSTRPSSRGW